MTTSTLNQNKSSTLIDHIQIDELIDKAISDYPKKRIMVVLFGKASRCTSRVHKLGLEYFSCKDVHTFLSLGLDKSPSILLFESEPTSCSLENLKLLLENRSDQPREILNLANIAIEKIDQIILKSYKRIQKLSSIEDKIYQYSQRAYYAAGSKASNSSDQTLSDLPSKNLRLTQQMLRSKVSEKINQSPEEFLQEAISYIRR